MAEQEREQLYTIISDSNSYEFIRPGSNERVKIKFLPDKTISIKREPLTLPEEIRLDAEGKFTETVRGLITYSLELKAAKTQPGSETIGHELEVDELENEFNKSIKALADMHLSNRAIQRLITEQAKLFSIGAEHIGFMPTIIQEELTRLNRIVDVYFQQRAKGQSNTT